MVNWLKFIQDNLHETPGLAHKGEGELWFNFADLEDMVGNTSQSSESDRGISGFHFQYGDKTFEIHCTEYMPRNTMIVLCNNKVYCFTREI